MGAAGGAGRRWVRLMGQVEMGVAGGAGRRRVCLVGQEGEGCGWWGR